MADNKTDFEIYLKSKWDGDAMKAAEADFRKTQKAVKDTKEEMGVMGQAAGALKTQLAGLLAFAEVVAQFKEGFEQVAALEQAMNQLERATARNGDSFAEVKEQIVGMANALKKAAGVDDDAAIKKMSELYNATGDVANAMNLVALAADVAIGAGIEFEQANDLVTKAAMGQTRGLKELGISIEETGEKTKNADLALAVMRKNFGGAANDAKGLKVEMNRLSESYEDMRNTAVERLMPGMSAAIKSVEAFFIMLDGFWRILSSTMVSAANAIVNAGSAVWKMLKGDFTGAKASFASAKKDLAEWGDDVVESAQLTAGKVAEAWSGAKGGIKAGPAKNIVNTSGGGGKEGKSRELTQSELDIMEVSKFEEKIRAARLKAEENAAKQMNKWKEDGLATGRRVIQELDRERDAELDRAIKRTRDEVMLRKQAEKAEQEMALETMSMISGALSTLFGESKEVAVAEAIINTYVGASKALAQTGIWGVVQAAIIIAAGMAQVAKIQSTEPSTKGSGFDDPGNDAAARIGGRRWAADMIGEFTSGASQGWAQGMRASGNQTTTNDNRRTFNVHMHGAGFIDPTNINSMKQFHRALQIIDTQYAGQRTVARAR